MVLSFLVRSIGRALARFIHKMNRIADLALGVGQHRPGQGRDFLGAQPRPDREQEDRPIPLRVSGRSQISQDPALRAEALNREAPSLSRQLPFCVA
jgi:hypothetical protein